MWAEIALSFRGNYREFYLIFQRRPGRFEYLDIWDDWIRSNLWISQRSKWLRYWHWKIGIWNYFHTINHKFASFEFNKKLFDLFKRRNRTVERRTDTILSLAERLRKSGKGKFTKRKSMRSNSFNQFEIRKSV